MKTCDVDDDGKIYVADRGANTIQIFSPEGTLLRIDSGHNPISVAALPEGEVAVATLRERASRDWFSIKMAGTCANLAIPNKFPTARTLNRFLNIGQLASDAQGHLYYGFPYTPEPTVRQYDRNGYGVGPGRSVPALEAAPAAQAIRREIHAAGEAARSRHTFKRILTADCRGSTRTVRFGWRSASHASPFRQGWQSPRQLQLYTPEGARHLDDKQHLLVGNEPGHLRIPSAVSPDNAAAASTTFDRPEKKVYTIE